MKSPILFCLVLTLLATTPALAQRFETSRESRKRVYIRRGPLEERPTPDILTLADGTRLEVYFLQVLGDRAVFYLEEDDRFWVREELPTGEIRFLQRNQYLPVDPLQGGAITRREKQPADKDEILAGVFSGSRGRYATWRIEFHAENDKVDDFTEDAIEHGRFTLESDYRQPTADRSFAHEVSARGKYHLYAPGSVNNEEWLLVLSEVVQRDRDHSPERSYGTRVIGYEALIVEFTDRRFGGFRLHFSNIGDSVWGAITQPTFERLGAEPPPPPSSFDGRGRSGGDGTMTSTRLLRADWWGSAAARPPARRSIEARGDADDHDGGDAAAATPRSPRGIEKLRARSWAPDRWKTGGWGRPATRWGGR